MSRFEYVVKPPPGDVNPFLAAADPTKTWCQKFGKQAIEVAITLGVNVVLPIIIVQVLKATTDLSDARRVLFSGVPSVLHAILGLIFRRKLDIVAGLNILSVLWTLLIMALWPGDARLLLLNQSFPTALIGLISLASVFALTYVCTERDIRPLTYYFGREAAALGDENKAIWWNYMYETYPSFRAGQILAARVWGWGFVLEITVKLILIYYCFSVDTMTTVAPVMFAVVFIALIKWQISDTLARRKEGERLRQLQDEESTYEPPQSSLTADATLLHVAEQDSADGASQPGGAGAAAYIDDASVTDQASEPLIVPFSAAVGE